MSLFTRSEKVNTVYLDISDRVADPGGFYPDSDPIFEKNPDPTSDTKKTDPELTFEREKTEF